MRTSILLFLLSYFFLDAFGQENIVLNVYNKDNSPIAYSNVIIDHDSQFLGDQSGCIYIDKKILNIGDSISVSFLGYHTRTIVVDKAFLDLRMKRIQLDEQIYNLNEVEVSTNFNALKFLKRKMDCTVAPFLNCRKIEMCVSYRRVLADSLICKSDSLMLLNYTGSLADSLLLGSVITNPLVKSVTIETYDKALNFPRYMLSHKLRKYFRVKYIGKKDDQYVFSMIYQPKSYKKKHFNLDKEDQLKIVFNINERGAITYAKYHLIRASDKDLCYQLSVSYATHKRLIIPVDMDLKFYHKKSTLHIKTNEKL